MRIEHHFDSKEEKVSIKKSIKNNLELILNSKKQCHDVPDELKGTVIDYGIPDMTDILSAEDHLRTLIEANEPRLKNVNVTLTPEETIKLTIEADVLSETPSVPVTVSYSLSQNLSLRPFKMTEHEKNTD